MSREDIYKTINLERDYQDRKWGGDSHDKNHTVGDWMIYAQHHLDKAKAYYSTEKDNRKTLEELRKVTALLVACFEQEGIPERDLWPGAVTVLFPTNVTATIPTMRTTTSGS